MEAAGRIVRVPFDPLRPVDDLDAARALFAALGERTQETLVIAYLDPKRRFLGSRHIVGIVDRVSVSIRRIAADALAFDAYAIVMAHNHPSGDATPSERDLAFTRALARGLRALEIVLVDHLVIAGDEVTSLRATGVL